MLDQPVNIRSGEELDVNKLSSYLLNNLPDMSGELSVAQFPSGYSNLTYMISIGNHNYVLRKPPFGAKIKSGHDMGREFKVLTGLTKVWDKVPEPILFCSDESVMGADFYIMERVEGVILRAKMPKEDQPDEQTMSKIAHALVKTFVELHELDYEAAGLKDLGRPIGYVDRQVSGWTKRYFNAKTDEVPEVEKTAAWLAHHLPDSKSSAATLIHNDFKYDNLVLAPEDLGQVRAVLDWEMCTLGDPLMDLGTTLGYWINHDDPDFLKQLALNPTTQPGNPTRGALAESYADLSGRTMKDLVFYYVYGLFKISVITQQIYARYKKGLTQDKRFASLNFVVKGLGTMAQQAIAKGRIDRLF